MENKVTWQYNDSWFPHDVTLLNKEIATMIVFLTNSPGIECNSIFMQTFSLVFIEIHAESWSGVWKPETGYVVFTDLENN